MLFNDRLSCATIGGSRQKRKSTSLTEQTEIEELPEEAEEGDKEPARKMERGGTCAAVGRLPKGGASDAKGNDCDSWATHSAVDDEETETDDDFMPVKDAKVGNPCTSTEGQVNLQCCQALMCDLQMSVN